VPYKGTGNAMPDVAGGRVTSIFAGYTGGASYMQAGKLRPIGVTGTERMAALPNVPTFKEQGVDYTYYFWLGLLRAGGYARRCRAATGGGAEVRDHQQGDHRALPQRRLGSDAGNVQGVQRLPGEGRDRDGPR
jgi:hypothetical protein